MLASMLRTLGLLVMLCASVMRSTGQSPSTETLHLSLKTMSKALDGCHTSYLRIYPGSSTPLLKTVLGPDDYNKDLMSMGTAERLVNALISHPDKVTGKTLVMILSTSDDFSVGVGSTRAELLRHVVLDTASQKTNQLLVAAESLNDCQKSLFNAGDDFVELVMNYVGAEDDALAAIRSRGHTK
jgi:hypothetical protein